MIGKNWSLRQNIKNKYDSDDEEDYKTDFSMKNNDVPLKTEQFTYIINCHGGQSGTEFVVPRGLNGNVITISYASDPYAPGAITKRGEPTGTMLWTTPTDINDVCEGNFQPTVVRETSNLARDIFFSSLPPAKIGWLPFAVYACYKEGGEHIVPLTMIQDLTHISELPLVELDHKLSTYITYIERYHSNTPYSNVPINIVVYTCTVSHYWRNVDFKITPGTFGNFYYVPTELTDELSNLNISSAMEIERKNDGSYGGKLNKNKRKIKRRNKEKTKRRNKQKSKHGNKGKTKRRNK
jgi:hypothetical protein